MRRGTTTERAAPTDYARFFRQHLDEHTYELRAQIEGLGLRIAELERKAVPREAPPLAVPQVPASRGQEAVDGPAKPDVPMDLLGAIANTLSRSEDPVARGLTTEAQKIAKFLQSETIRWDLPGLDKNSAKQLLDELENVPQYFGTD